MLKEFPLKLKLKYLIRRWGWFLHRRQHWTNLYCGNRSVTWPHSRTKWSCLRLLPLQRMFVAKKLRRFWRSADSSQNLQNWSWAAEILGLFIYAGSFSTHNKVWFGKEIFLIIFYARNHNRHGWTWSNFLQNLYESANYQLRLKFRPQWTIF